MIATIKNRLSASPLLKNGLWGIVANIFQILFASIFFLILARKFQPYIFAQFLIAQTVYQLISSFSSMGLGQWFIREYESKTDAVKIEFASKFLKIQIGLGILFYVLNILFAMVLYRQTEIILLSILLGANIIFDNLIYALKNLNIVQHEQKKTFVITVIDNFLKLVIGLLLFVFPLNIYTVSILLIVARISIVNLSLRIGATKNITLTSINKIPVLLNDLRFIIIQNWRFVVIGSISIIYWRISNLIISKLLTFQDIANYEIAFRIFSIQILLPVIGSSTIFPKLVKYWNDKDIPGLKLLYRNAFLIYSLYALLSYFFVYAFAGPIIIYPFGTEYSGAVPCLKEMFLTAIVFPTVLLQANVIVAMRLEKRDMWFNIISLVMNILFCLVGLTFVKSLSTVNYSICFSFIIFHLLQSNLLLKKQITGRTEILFFYLITITVIISYQYLINNYSNIIVFFLSTLFITIPTIIYIFYSKPRRSYPISAVFENPQI